MEEKVNLSHSHILKTLRKYNIEGFGIERRKNIHIWNEVEAKQIIIKAIKENPEHHKFQLKKLGVSGSTIERWKTKYKDFIEEQLKNNK